ncbi:Satratoxin biosynthesis SC1 cluster protein 4 [Colletotrichum orbiculare MAFF 240422]|uniref:Satratoxin biosynthesis SC1 cluster protein 4 n=1 Tax=Colletotrichum orbiculare (strain 104-T / ATCC 96160 / CBS 514.97 / LARS 414 / MAFF 240422) TaxID=1213857 RepID=A0A484G682_COLOR|nr:Satratoxin biosynthesis SC1 cluster protein 4 [Colletotrichum orbiculare MAFF 240422]
MSLLRYWEAPLFDDPTTSFEINELSGLLPFVGLVLVDHLMLPTRMLVIEALAAGLFLGKPALAQSATLAESPDCALPCIRDIILDVDCVASNETCICEDQSFLRQLETCIATDCTLRDALVTQKNAWTACNFPLHDEFPATRVPRIALSVLLPTVSIVLRVSVKVARISPWGADDATMIVAYLLTAVLVCFTARWEMYGAGKDLWTLDDNQVTQSFKNFFVLQLIYHCLITLLKASVLFLFLRIFPDRKFRITVWATQVFNLVVGITYALVTIFQCSPVSLAWTFWTGDFEGHCINIGIPGASQCAVSILLDMWLLVLPATQVWNLNVKRRRKAAFMLMFSLGLFITVVSILRMVSLIEMAKYPLNPTVAMMSSIFWTDLEIFVAVFTTCLPNTLQFARHFIIRPIKAKLRREPTPASERSPSSIPKTPARPSNEEMEETR